MSVEINAIEVTHLSKRVQDATGMLTILDDITFCLRAGESLAITGASGSGKSTLLGLLAGLDTPTSGQVNLLGQSLFALDEDGRAALRAKSIGFVFQSFHLLPNLNALENVIIELGGNDALRGLPLEMTRQNLNTMATQASASGAKVAIVGMQIPPNYGREYATGFKEVFETVAKQQNASLVPFLLEGVAADPKYLQADNLHPNELAQPQMMRNVLEVVQPLLKP